MAARGGRLQRRRDSSLVALGRSSTARSSPGRPAAVHRPSRRCVGRWRGDAPSSPRREELRQEHGPELARTPSPPLTVCRAAAWVAAAGTREERRRRAASSLSSPAGKQAQSCSPRRELLVARQEELLVASGSKRLNGDLDTIEGYCLMHCYSNNEHGPAAIHMSAQRQGGQYQEKHARLSGTRTKSCEHPI